MLMNELQELLDLDVSDSMKSNIDALCRVIETIDLQNKDEAIDRLNQVHTKILEIEEYFWRPVDSEDIYQKLMGIFRGYFAPPVPKKGRSKHICENRSNQILGGEK